jgi:hypothetical protein
LAQTSYLGLKFQTWVLTYLSLWLS